MKTALLTLLALVRQPLARLLQSMKFWTLVLGALTTQAAKYGFEVNTTTYWTLVYFFLALIGAQGLNDLGKAKAEIERRDIQGGFAQLRVMFVVAIAGLWCTTLLAVVGCGWVRSETRRVAADVVDCTTDKALELAKEYGPSVELALRSQLSDTGQIDRAGLKALAKSFASDTGQCVLAREVARLLTPRGADAQSTPLPVDIIDVAAAWNEVWRAELGGKTYSLGDS